MAGSIVLKVFRGVSLLCLCIVGAAVVVAPLELVAYPILKSIGCSLTEGRQSFTCGGGWVGHFISTVLNLPILFSDAREFTFGAGAPFGRGNNCGTHDIMPSSPMSPRGRSRSTAINIP